MALLPSHRTSRGAAAATAIALAALAGCRHARPEPAKTAERALVEVAPEEVPAFADDLEYAGLDDALSRSADHLARIAAADPSRTYAFGKERVPVQKLQATLARFREIALARPTAAELQQTLRREFRVFRSVGDGTGVVLVTGYYLPELRGASVRGGPYQVPLHRAPDDLVVVRAKDFPQLTDDLVGRVESGRLVPYPTRAEIAGGAVDDRSALCFVDSAVDAFFLEIQGSGVVRFEDGTSRVVTFAGKNGHRYEAIGAELVRRGAIAPGQMSMQAIRGWLAANPEEQPALLARNPSYVFFRFAEAPTGSLGVPVTPDRTIAADARVFPKSALAFLSSERPVDATGIAMRPFSRFVLDQDAGGAIRTSARVDLYLGSGAYAENAAGRMRQPGRLYYLLLR
jgi:membrane-bound lytic murein transglycosylase A